MDFISTKVLFLNPLIWSIKVANLVNIYFFVSHCEKLHYICDYCLTCGAKIIIKIYKMHQKVQKNINNF